MNLVQMSIAGTCIILFATVLRALAMYRLPRRAFSILWAIACVRLVVPFSIPWPFGLFALVERSAPAIQTKAAAPPFHDAEALTDAIQTYIRTAPAHSPVARPTISLWALAWLAGCGVCALLFARAYIHWHRIFRDSTPVDNAFARQWLHGHALRRPVSIRQTSGVTAPLTYGVLRPVILMPEGTDWTDTATLNYIFAHEFAHIRRFDALRKPLLAIAPCIHWFNPMVWVMYVLANRDIELACDEAVIHAQGANARKSYAFTLLNLEERRGGFAALTNSFSQNAIEERIQALMKMRKTTLPAILLAMLLIVSMTAAFATSAPAKSASENRFAVGYEADAVEEPGKDADYTVYEPFGLRYDGKNDRYTYNGSVVAFFNDPVNGASFTNYFTGTIELEAEYDEDGTLVGIRECDPETYARHAEKRIRFGKVREASDSSEETAQPQAQSNELDWMKKYTPYGFSYDTEHHRLTYFGQQVKILSDPGKSAIYLSDDGDICLVIQRNIVGAVSAIEECSEEEARALMRDMNPAGGNLTWEDAASGTSALDESAMNETALRRLAERYPEMEEWVRTQYPDAVWWTVEDYSAWMDSEHTRLINLLGETVGENSQGPVVVDQAFIDEGMAGNREILRWLAEGWLVSKSIGGNENLGVTIKPEDWANGRGEREFELAFQLKDGTVVNFGPYDTVDALLAEFIPFSQAQIAAENLDPSEAEEIVQFYRDKA